MALDDATLSLYQLAMRETGGALSTVNTAQGSTGTATIETADNDRTFAIFGAPGQPLP